MKAYFHNLNGSGIAEDKRTINDKSPWTLAHMSVAELKAYRDNPEVPPSMKTKLDEAMKIKPTLRGGGKELSEEQLKKSMEDDIQHRQWLYSLKGRLGMIGSAELGMALDWYDAKKKSKEEATGKAYQHKDFFNDLEKEWPQYYHWLKDDETPPADSAMAPAPAEAEAAPPYFPEWVQMPSRVSDVGSPAASPLKGGLKGVSKASGFIQRMMAENKKKHNGSYKPPTEPAAPGSTMKAWRAFDYKKLANASQGGERADDRAQYGASPFIEDHFKSMVGRGRETEAQKAYRAMKAAERSAKLLNTARYLASEAKEQKKKAEPRPKTLPPPSPAPRAPPPPRAPSPPPRAPSPPRAEPPPPVSPAPALEEHFGNAPSAKPRIAALVAAKKEAMKPREMAPRDKKEEEDYSNQMKQLSTARGHTVVNDAQLALDEIGEKLMRDAPNGFLYLKEPILGGITGLVLENRPHAGRTRSERVLEVIKMKAIVEFYARHSSKSKRANETKWTYRWENWEIIPIDEAIQRSKKGLSEVSGTPRQVKEATEFWEEQIKSAERSKEEEYWNDYHTERMGQLQEAIDFYRSNQTEAPPEPPPAPKPPAQKPFHYQYPPGHPRDPMGRPYSYAELAPMPRY